MKITVISDSHRNFHRLKSVVERNLDSDLFIHLGDGMLEVVDVSKMFPEKSFVFVKGNSDFIRYKEERVVEIGGHRIFCSHGHNYDVHWGLDSIIRRAYSERCNIVLFGHTHIYRTDCVNGMYIMNPGSIDRPRGKNRPTYGTILLSPDGNVSLNIIAFKS
ncbi:MAG: YfcE family phosphodiesterase [Oscillospiraceae bacterium]|jgi:putative phosphoesterase|nr:YfcE family phosphodiesterase [Oscillospiraceae bacterium]